MKKLLFIAIALLSITTQAQEKFDFYHNFNKETQNYNGFKHVPVNAPAEAAVDIYQSYGNLEVIRMKTRAISGRDNALIEIYYDCGSDNNHGIGAWTFTRSFLWSMPKPLEYKLKSNKINIKFYMMFKGQIYKDFTIKYTDL